MQRDLPSRPAWCTSVISFWVILFCSDNDVSWSWRGHDGGSFWSKKGPMTNTSLAWRPQCACFLSQSHTLKKTPKECKLVSVNPRQEMPWSFRKRIISYNHLRTYKIHLIGDYEFFIHWSHTPSISKWVFTLGILLTVKNSENKQAFLVEPHPLCHPIYF